MKTKGFNEIVAMPLFIIIYCNDLKYFCTQNKKDLFFIEFLLYTHVIL